MVPDFHPSTPLGRWYVLLVAAAIIAGCGEPGPGERPLLVTITEVTPTEAIVPAAVEAIVVTPPLPLADPHAGRRYSLGIQSIGGATVTALQMGGVYPGRESLIRLTVFGVEDGTAVRVWLGGRTAPERDKALAERGGRPAEHFARVTAPDALSSDAAWWVEISPADGGARARPFPINY